MFQMNARFSLFSTHSVSLIYVAFKYERQRDLQKTSLNVFVFHVKTGKVGDLQLKMYEIAHLHRMLMFTECQADGSALTRLQTGPLSLDPPG